jgi:uncharacterized protein involved in exopolysaccharide biosynthesis
MDSHSKWPAEMSGAQKSTDAAPVADDGEVSVFAIGTALLCDWKRIARWVAYGVGVALLVVFIPARTYTAKASFLPVAASEASRSNLSALASQFGVVLGTPAAGQDQSPEFYAELIRARAILVPIIRDTLVIDGNRRSLIELLQVSKGPEDWRVDEAVTRLTEDVISTQISTSTRIVSLAVTTKVGDLSLALTRRLVDAVNAFNLQARQSQAKQERQFTQKRLVEAHESLNAAESRLGRFLETNRTYEGSPLLVFEHDRLQRDVALRQQVVVALAQSLEEVQSREIRDIPLITTIEEPYLVASADPLRLVLVLGGALFGGIIGMILVVMSDLVRRRKAANDPDVVGFLNAVTAKRSAVLRVLHSRQAAR